VPTGGALAPPIQYAFEAPYVVLPEGVRMLVQAADVGRLQVEAEATGPSAWRACRCGPPLGGAPRPRRGGLPAPHIPYGVVSAEAAERLSRLSADEVLADVTAYWRGVVNSERGRISTPDPFVNDYVAAVAGQMAQQVAWRGQSDLWMYKTSPNEYEAYWPCNAGKATPAFGLRGLVELERRVLGGFVQCQSDDVGGLERGAMGGGEHVGGEGYARLPGFLGNFGGWTANPLLLSHGLGIWAMAAHFRTTRDRCWLGDGPGSPLQTMLDACDWVAHQRPAHDARGGRLTGAPLGPLASGLGA